MFNRFKEPSTWASIAALAAIFAPQYAQQIGAAGVAIGGIAGALGVVMPERKAP